jgi:hypothetical protein
MFLLKRHPPASLWGEGLYGILGGWSLLLYGGNPYSPQEIFELQLLASSCLYRHKSLPCPFENMGGRRALVLLVRSGVFIELRYFSLGETTQQDGCGGLKKGRIASMTDSEFAICCSKPVLC